MIDRLSSLRPSERRYLDMLAAVAGAVHGIETCAARILDDLAGEGCGPDAVCDEVELAAAGDVRATARLMRLLGLVAD